MRFSTGLMDSLFGEKITLEGHDEKGNVVKCKVSKKWLEEAQGGGEISDQTEQDKDHLVHNVY
ncbi:hypothetical protein [Desulfosporosinus sp. Sb-LF]|uniref:hypothetical protein n=1 Tax=Desulfosporosinus sp. Sb-LF TaxID=2560027 RepID=UPI00107EF460|nr:hypothetical protein [Desulfosporosinus sp. Sb-LF]TGE33551.1 hypothetical protein E4K68_05230 [Desulfosporosinus sp. Sb-LF]